MSPSLSNTQKPNLWTYACQQYPGYKTELLAFQDKGLSVNDLLTLSYACRYSLSMDKTQWEALACGRTRKLLERVRCIRLGLSKTSPLREAALGWELTLERWDLHLLEQCLHPTDKWQHQWPPQSERLTSEERLQMEALVRDLST